MILRINPIKGVFQGLKGIIACPGRHCEETLGECF